MRAYSMDLRKRVWADCEAGMATAEVAAKFSVSKSWVRRLKQRYKANGSLAPRPPSSGRPVVLAPHDAQVREVGPDRPRCHSQPSCVPAVGCEGQPVNPVRVPAADQPVV